MPSWRMHKVSLSNSRGFCRSLCETKKIKRLAKEKRPSLRRKNPRLLCILQNFDFSIFIFQSQCQWEFMKNSSSVVRAKNQNFKIRKLNFFHKHLDFECRLDFSINLNDMPWPEEFCMVFVPKKANFVIQFKFLLIFIHNYRSQISNQSNPSKKTSSLSKLFKLWKLEQFSPCNKKMKINQLNLVNNMNL